MKTQESHPGYIKLIQVNMVLFGLLISFLSLANPILDNPLNKSLLNVTSNNGLISVQNEAVSKDISWLAPTAPAEVDFSDEDVDTEVPLSQKSAEEAPSEWGLELTNSSALEYLSPTTPLLALFDE